MNIIYIIYNFLSIILIYKNIKKIMKDEITYNKIIEIITYFIFLCLSSYVFLKIGIPIFILITNFLCLFLIQFNYKTNIKDKLIISMYILLILAIVDIVTFIIIENNIIKVDVKSTYKSITSWSLQLIINWLLLKSLKNFSNIKYCLSTPNIFWIPLVTVPLLSIFSVIFLLLVGRKNITIIFVMILVIIIINITMFILYNYIIDYIKNEIEVKFYSNQLKIMKSNYETLEILRHDWKKHISFLNTLLNENRIEDVKKYLKDISKEMIVDKQFNINSGNIIIDSILNTKFQEVLYNNIKLEYKILLPNDLILNEFDMVCILQNIIDNIIEANLKIKNINERYAFISIEYKKGVLKIFTKNSYKDIKLDSKNNIITSKKNIIKHGLGLKSIKKIVDKYSGDLKINVTPKEFEMEILLFYILNQ